MFQIESTYPQRPPLKCWTGKPLNKTIPANVQAICSALNWPCLDESIHTRTTVQHANYDERAACGSGKSSKVRGTSQSRSIQHKSY